MARKLLTSFFGLLVILLGIMIFQVSCNTIPSDDGVALDSDSDPSNNDDNLPNNLQPFLPEDNDAGSYIRALLCPNTPIEALPYFRFHLTTRNCYEVGTQGPCGPNMIFVKEPLTKAIGKCICVSSDNNHRPLLRDPNTNQCYYVYTQAFCPEGEWLTLNENNHVVCEENPCSHLEFVPIIEDNNNNNNENDTSSSNSNTNINSYSHLNTGTSSNSNNDLLLQQYVVYNGTCTQLDSSSEHCEEDQIISFVNGELTCRFNTNLDELALARANGFNTAANGNNNSNNNIKNDEEENQIHR